MPQVFDPILRSMVAALAGVFLLGSAMVGTARAAEESLAPKPIDAAPPAAAAPKADAAIQAPAQSVVDSSSYIIGPGDAIQVFVWRSPELTVTVPVRPDGKISTPLVEDLVAVGKTPSQLARDIEVRLAEFVRTPQVNVIVTAPANAFNQVKVIGQVNSPQSLAYRAGMTVLDAILQSGGLTEFAAGNRAMLVRKDGSGKEVRQKVRVNDLIKKGNISANVELKPGDVLIIPESVF